MDPATLLSLISTAGTIAGKITKTIRDLSDLRATYVESNVRIKLLIKELSTIKSSLTQINDWAHFLDETHDQIDLKDALQVALDGVELAMEALAEEVRDLLPDAIPASHVQLGFRAKTKYAWNEQNIKEHENRLRAQISALNLLLQAAQLPSRPEQADFLKAPQSRHIIQKVADDTMTLRNTMSVAGSQRGPPTILSHEDSPIDEKVFDWDNDIVHAAAYRRALHHNVSKQRMGDKPPPQPRGSVQIHIGSDDGKDEFTPSPSLTPSRESRALPYENSVVSEPVNMLYGPGNKTYVPLSSQSGVAPEHHRPLTELGKKTFWSSWTQKRSNRNVNSLTPTGSNPGTPSSSSTPGSHRGKRGFENSSHASIDFGSENGLSAPSIVRAAQAGSVMEVEMLLNNGADVESVHQQSGRTALAVASHCGNKRVVQLLLQYDANVNTRDASSLCPLHLAAMRGHDRVIALLLQEHVKIDEPGPNEETPLRIAAEKGYMKCVELLLQTRAKVNTRDRKRRRTPLHVAAANGDEAMAGLLIKNGAHMEAKDGELMTPLHEACEAGHDRVVIELLNRKASPETPGRRGMTPVICAAAAGQVPIIEILLKRKASLKHQAEGDMTALHWAAYNGHDEAVDYLLQKKAPPHVANKDGRTALHLSIMAGHFAVVELLLRRGAAVEAQCRTMKRPIHYACQQQSAEIVQLLLGHNADPEVECSGRRPLHDAAAKGMASLVSILLSRGVDIEARDADGERALGLASRMGHLAIVQMLLDRGSRIRSKFAKAHRMKTHHCVSRREAVILLWFRSWPQLGLDFFLNSLLAIIASCSRSTNVTGGTDLRHFRNALQYASHYAHPSVVEFLLSEGATVSGNPSSGWGFDMTARRIGFADEVLREGHRKARVLQLLIDAEAKEQKSREEESTTQHPSPARSSMGSPAELAEGPTQKLSPEQPGVATSTPENEAIHSTTTPSELDARLRSPSLATSGNAAATTKESSRSVNPAPDYIANSFSFDFGFDPFPQQRVSSEYAPRPNSAIPYSTPAPKSVVHIGPDGMWRLHPTPTSTQQGTTDEAAQSIYEIES
ncbi:MAG: hypothetical protein LQ341_005145 [Variospora aurantia]|nr:MAG: hypothetical protein LQ341_005145 [Variospora aurantia]